MRHVPLLTSIVIPSGEDRSRSGRSSQSRDLLFAGSAMGQQRKHVLHRQLVGF